MVGLMNKDGKGETHYTKIKFGLVHLMQNYRQKSWLQDWWRDYGLNATAMDPTFYENWYQSRCDICDCEEFDHLPFSNVINLLQADDTLILKQHMVQHNEWFFMTKIKHQIVLNKPMIVRRIYTKAWDANYKLCFPGIQILDIPPKSSTSGSHGLH